LAKRLDALEIYSTELEAKHRFGANGDEIPMNESTSHLALPEQSTFAAWLSRTALVGISKILGLAGCKQLSSTKQP